MPSVVPVLVPSTFTHMKRTGIYTQDFLQMLIPTSNVYLF